MGDHFEVITKSGVHYGLGKRCNRVTYDNDHYCIFKHINDDGNSYDTLALIPHSNIETILNVEDEDGEDL